MLVRVSRIVVSCNQPYIGSNVAAPANGDLADSLIIIAKGLEIVQIIRVKLYIFGLHNRDPMGGREADTLVGAQQEPGKATFSNPFPPGTT